MKLARSSLWLLAVGLAAGLLAAYWFRWGRPGSRPAPWSMTQAPSSDIVYVNLGMPRLPAAGAVRDATEATARAVVGANEAAQTSYGITPFAMDGTMASFDGRRWIWKRRVACGKDDLEAEVWLSPDGIIEKLDVKLLLYGARNLMRQR